MGTRGPLPKGSQPCKTKFRSPVKICSSFMRGDGISKHFQDNSNLFVLDKAVENSSQLRKIMSAGDTVKESDEFLVSLLLQSTNSEKLHTKYLYENSHTSTKLPNTKSINFKCQLKRKPISKEK